MDVLLEYAQPSSYHHRALSRLEKRKLLLWIRSHIDKLIVRYNLEATTANLLKRCCYRVCSMTCAWPDNDQKRKTLAVLTISSRKTYSTPVVSLEVHLVPATWEIVMIRNPMASHNWWSMFPATLKENVLFRWDGATPHIRGRSLDVVVEASFYARHDEFLPSDYDGPLYPDVEMPFALNRPKSDKTMGTFQPAGYFRMDEYDTERYKALAFVDNDVDLGGIWIAYVDVTMMRMYCARKWGFSTMGDLTVRRCDEGFQCVDMYNHDVHDGCVDTCVLWKDDLSPHLPGPSQWEKQHESHWTTCFIDDQFQRLERIMDLWDQQHPLSLKHTHELMQKRACCGRMQEPDQEPDE